jgi:hypothetical protein
MEGTVDPNCGRKHLGDYRKWYLIFIPNSVKMKVPLMIVAAQILVPVETKGKSRAQRQIASGMMIPCAALPSLLIILRMDISQNIHCAWN